MVLIGKVAIAQNYIRRFITCLEENTEENAQLYWDEPEDNFQIEFRYLQNINLFNRLICNKTSSSLAASYWGICMLVSAFILLRRLKLASVSIFHSYRPQRWRQVDQPQFVDGETSSVFLNASSVLIKMEFRWYLQVLGRFHGKFLMFCDAYKWFVTRGDRCYWWLSPTIHSSWSATGKICK